MAFKINLDVTKQAVVIPAGETITGDAKMTRTLAMNVNDTLALDDIKLPELQAFCDKFNLVQQRPRPVGPIPWPLRPMYAWRLLRTGLFPNPGDW